MPRRSPNRRTRPGDLAARYGGEEFLLVLPDTNSQGAECIARRLRKHIRNLQIPHGRSTISPHVTVSLGIASAVPQLQQSSQGLLLAADRALYGAKQAGRDGFVAVTPVGGFFPRPMLKPRG
ncbi:MAG: diguanylate cyclase [Chloroflexaceae bacterium]|nr:diguanylate cyclase [Chloroflexaceae bacterium]